MKILGTTLLFLALAAGLPALTGKMSNGFDSPAALEGLGQPDNLRFCPDKKAPGAGCVAIECMFKGGGHNFPLPKGSKQGVLSFWFYDPLYPAEHLLPLRGRRLLREAGGRQAAVGRLSAFTHGDATTGSSTTPASSQYGAGRARPQTLCLARMAAGRASTSSPPLARGRGSSRSTSTAAPAGKTVEQLHRPHRRRGQRQMGRRHHLFRRAVLRLRPRRLQAQRRAEPRPGATRPPAPN